MIIGYKEWSLVCEALGSGAQNLLLRKGGIAEGKGGFAFKYPRFALFPTLFHQQEEQVRWTPRQESVRDPQGAWIVRHEADLVATATLTDWEQVQSLQPFHIWKESVIHERFLYEGNNRIHAALVRVRKFREHRVFPESRELGGCRSWVELPAMAGTEVESSPVQTDQVFSGIKEHVRKLFKFEGA